MTEHLHRDPSSLDGRAFAVVLSAMFVCTLLWMGGSVVGETAARPVAVAAAPSQPGCAGL